MNIPIIKFEEWLRNKNLKERTIENYIYYFNKFTFESFNQETTSRFLSDKSNRNGIARSFLVNFQKFLRVNYQELGISLESRLKITEVELPNITGRKKVRLINPIPHEHIALLEKHLESEQFKLQLLLSYYCALRLGELLKITILSFNWEGWKKNTLKMGECRVYGKGDREGIALVPPFIMKRVALFIKSQKYRSLNERLFIKGDFEVNLKNKAKTWQNRLKDAGIKAGITKLDAQNKIINGTGVHPHRLRHSYASYLLNEKGLNLREVQEILRHASIQNTQIYTHINKEHLKEKLSEN